MLIFGGSRVGLVHLWTDQRIPGPVSCRCPGGLLETLPRWHVTIYTVLVKSFAHLNRIFSLEERVSPPPSGGSQKILEIKCAKFLTSTVFWTSPKPISICSNHCQTHPVCNPVHFYIILPFTCKLCLQLLYFSNICHKICRRSS